MPIGSASTQVKISAASETTIVSQQPVADHLGDRAAATPSHAEVAAQHQAIQLQYWTYIGWSRPYWARRFSASCCETTLP